MTFPSLPAPRVRHELGSGLFLGRGGREWLCSGPRCCATLTWPPKEEEGGEREKKKGDWACAGDILNQGTSARDTIVLLAAIIIIIAGRLVGACNYTIM